MKTKRAYPKGFKIKKPMRLSERSKRFLRMMRTDLKALSIKEQNDLVDALLGANVEWLELRLLEEETR